MRSTQARDTLRHLKRCHSPHSQVWYDCVRPVLCDRAQLFMIQKNPFKSDQPRALLTDKGLVAS
jgi:hypothetical protein